MREEERLNSRGAVPVYTLLDVDFGSTSFLSVFLLKLKNNAVSPLRHGNVEVSKLSESARNGPTRIFGKYRHLKFNVVSYHSESGDGETYLKQRKQAHILLVLSTPTDLSIVVD